MKPKYIVGSLAAAILIVVAVLTVKSSEIEYMDFTGAETSGRTAKVMGTWVKEQETKYEPKANEFHFTMRDDKGKIIPVVLHGAKPNNFEIASSVVATGAFDGKTFHATHVLTKCPSKYEATGDQLMEKQS
jgi:cytochrome c-type biogenesis protein CcmE